MRKLHIVSKKVESSKHSKYWLIVDENVEHLYPFLKKLGYNVTKFPSGMKDEVIHKEINKKRKSPDNYGVNKPFILITNDWDDFFKFSPRNYHIFALRYKVIPDGEHLANKIASLLDNCPNIKLVDGNYTPISSETKKIF